MTVPARGCAVIDVRNVRKCYGDLVAVDGLSFEVGGGETFGLLGPNGAGKTTTLHMLAGVLRPDDGTISLNGAADPTRPEVRRTLGVAPQSLAVYDHLSGEENVAFIGRLYGLRGPQLSSAVASALGRVGLTDRRRDRAATYSGGMKRRLNLACALVHDPPVLLLDEPTVGIDPQSRNHILDNITALAREGRTILYTTHYMEEAQKLCTRVAIMDHGKILALDTVDGLIGKHGGRAAVEAELAGTPPEAVALPGTLDGRRLRFESASPLEDLVALKERGLQVTSFRVDRPDLEAVFLNLTGRRLRD
jgi:ABC-2 type transport system ATP-binding protein